MIDWNGFWIWTEEDIPERNSFVRFRREFDYSGGSASLHITADSRYVLYVNGEYVGQGPVRAWPAHWRYDTYDIAPYLQSGFNVVAILVNHYGEGTFQYLPALPGLLAKIEINNGEISTDDTWLATPDNAHTNKTPRISVQEAFEEQFDARQDDSWTTIDYDDSAWLHAVELRPADDGIHRDPAPRGIPFLTMEPVLPKRLVSVEIVRSRPYIFTVNFRDVVSCDDKSSNRFVFHAYLATQIWSPGESTLHIEWSPIRSFKINGEIVADGAINLRPGWNSLVLRLFPIGHLLETSMCFDGPQGLRFCSTADVPAPAWAAVGPFGLKEESYDEVRASVDESILVVDPKEPACSVGEEFWRSGDVPSVVHAPWFVGMTGDRAPEANIFVQAYTDEVTGNEATVNNPEALLSGSGWSTVYPDANGCTAPGCLDTVLHYAANGLKRSFSWRCRASIGVLKPSFSNRQ